MSKEGSITTCRNCGEPLEANWAKCPVCLTPTSSAALTCPNCQAAIKENWKLCPHCKTTLPGWETPPVHKDSDVQKPTGSDKNQVFVTIADNEPMATVGFGFDLPVAKGDILGDRYKVIQPLGAGGFGAVYQVEDTVLNEQMALKVVVTGEGKAQRASEQILHEFKLREKINDLSHIVKAQDPRPCEYKGLSLVLLPMEFADGRSMRQWLMQNQDIEKRQKKGLELFRQACLGVKAIHDAGLVHLDIKPENILLVDAKAKIADFGIGRYGACQFAKNPGQLLHQGIGTPQYMSPEQFQVARQKDIGPASDIYSLGIVLFELLDGNVPFDGTPIELRDKHLKISLPQLPGKLGRWWGIVKRCLEKKVEDRYHSIKQLLKDLERVAEGTALSTDVSCPQCGHINSNTAARECEKCRANLASLFRLCPVCDKSVRLDVETCPVCGKAIAAHYLLLYRKERIEKLKDEDIVEAIELLEIVLQQESEDYHERAIQLLKDLRKKQSQINSLSAQAQKAEAACLPEKAIEIWQEILRIIPRHRIALEQVQKLESLMKDFHHRLEKAITLMDEAKFENADKLLQGCLELIPTRKDAKEMLEKCRKRAQEYTTAFNQASISQRNKLIQDADKQLNKALLQAPRSRETLALADKIHEITEKTNKLLYQAKSHLAQAEFSEADKIINDIEESQTDNNAVVSLKKELTKVRTSYTDLINTVKSSVNSRNLNEVTEIVEKAIKLCPESSEAQSLLEQIKEDRVHALIGEVETAISTASFDDAELLIKQISELNLESNDLNDIQSMLAKKRDDYNQHMDYARYAKAHRKFVSALESAQLAQEICPASNEPIQLKQDIESTKAEWQIKKQRIRHIVAKIVIWIVILSPGITGFVLLLHSNLLYGGIATGICLLATALNCKLETVLYKILKSCSIVKNGLRSAFIIASVLFTVSGISSKMFSHTTSPILPVIFTIYPLVEKYRFQVAVMGKWFLLFSPAIAGIGLFLYSQFALAAVAVLISIAIIIIRKRSYIRIVRVTKYCWHFAGKVLFSRTAIISLTFILIGIASFIALPHLSKFKSQTKEEQKSSEHQVSQKPVNIDIQAKSDKWFKLGSEAESKGDFKAAMSWYLKAAEANDSLSMNRIGNIYYDGKGVGKDYEKAIKWFKLSANDGNINSMLSLGLMYKLGRGANSDYQEALKWFRLAADAGDNRATLAIGVMYEQGLGESRSKDYAEAFKWYRKAAEANNVDAMQRVGMYHETGLGIGKDYKKAMKWYRGAANLGNSFSMNRLGIMYYRGKNVTKDYKEAIKWFRMSAEAGNNIGMLSVGLMYEKGFGISKNYAEAAKWYLKAATFDNSEAMERLGRFYQKGIGVQKNIKKSVDWYCKAAKAGNAKAMLNLVNMGYKGTDSEKYYLNVILQYEEALIKQPDDVSILNNLAYLLAQDKKQLERAMQYAEHAYKLSPDNPNIIDTYAYILCEKGEYAKAEKLLQKVIELTGKMDTALSRQIYEHLGLAQEGLGKRTAALISYKKALDNTDDIIFDDYREQLEQAIKRVSP